ncbi:MAG: sigma-70 family RNA polymerase sigma factor [Xylophilus ampelinus]
MPAPPAASPLLSVFQDCYADLVRFVARRTGDRQVARDLVHDAWLRLAEQPQPGAAPLAAAPARAYVYTVAENLVFDYLRRGRRTACRFESGDAGADGRAPSCAGCDVADIHAHRQAVAVVDRALRALPERSRSVFLADRLDGLDHATLARRHGVSVKTVERDVMRAMDGIESALRQWRGDAPAVRRGRRGALSALLGAAGLGLGGALVWQAWRQRVPGFALALETTTGRQAERGLPDGSILSLDARGRAEVAYFPDRRSVRLLAGSAFFAVARDASRPFTVEAAGHRVTVLGTRFEVALRPGAVEVAVESGRVRVDARDGGRRELAAGESARLPAAGGIAVGRMPHGAAVADWRAGWLDFRDAPLAEVVERLARYSPQALHVDPSAAALPVLARVRIADTAAWLRLLPATLPVRLRPLPDGGLRIERRG